MSATSPEGWGKEPPAGCELPAPPGLLPEGGELLLPELGDPPLLLEGLELELELELELLELELELELEAGT